MDNVAVEYFMLVLTKLKESGFLTDTLTMPDSVGKNDGAALSYMGVCKVREKHRRIDIKAYPGCQEAFATMYFTGSAHFNRSMRSFCKRAGLTLTDAGLALVTRGRDGKKLGVGKSVVCETEEQIMEAIGLKYVKPEFREIRGAGEAGGVEEFWGDKEGIGGWGEGTFDDDDDEELVW